MGGFPQSFIPQPAEGIILGVSGDSLPAATTSGPQQASGFGVPRTPTPRTSYESTSTPGFTYLPPPSWTPSNPAYSYPLPASSGKRSSASSSSTSSSSMLSSRSGSRSHRSRRSAGSTPVQNFTPLPCWRGCNVSKGEPTCSDDVYEHLGEFCNSYSADGYG